MGYSSSGSDSDEAFKKARKAAKKKKKEEKEKKRKGSSGGVDVPPPPPPSGEKKKSRRMSLSGSDSEVEMSAKGGAPPPPPPANSGDGAPPPPPPPGGAPAPPPPPGGAPPPPPPAAEDEVRVLNSDQLEREAPWDKNKRFSGVLEKTAKYSKRWVKRWVTLEDREFGYGLDENTPAKHKYDVVKVTRGAEEKNDPLSLIIDCEDMNVSPVQLIFRATDEAEFDRWLFRLRRCLIENGMMEDPEAGLPTQHPKTHLPFVSVPLELLSTFAPLDRLCLHFFSQVEQRKDAESAGLRGKLSKDGVWEKQVVFLGDRLLYVTKMDANITRCVKMNDIYRILTVKSTSEVAKDPMMHVGVQCSPPEHDLLIRLPPTKGEDFIKKLTLLHAEHSTSKKKLKSEQVDRVDLLAPQMTLAETDFYKLNITLPMSKRYLGKMIKQHEEEKGKGTAAGGAKAKQGSGPSKAKSPLIGTKANPMASLDADAGSPLSRRPSEPALKKQHSDGGIKPPQTTQGKAGTKGAGNLRIAGSPQTKADATGKVLIPPGVDNVHRLLLYVGLPQYYQVFSEKGIDWDVFLCMTANDLREKGVMELKHQQIIENALNDTEVMEAVKVDAAPAPQPPTGQNGPPKFSSASSNAPTTTSTKTEPKTIPEPVIISANGGQAIEFDDEDL